MAKGTVKKLIRERGFGFIEAEDGSEVFFHHSAVAGGSFESLAEGQKVEFEKERDPRGRGSRAANVRMAR